MGASGAVQTKEQLLGVDVRCQSMHVRKCVRIRLDETSLIAAQLPAVINIHILVADFSKPPGHLVVEDRQCTIAIVRCTGTAQGTNRLRPKTTIKTSALKCGITLRNPAISSGYFLNGIASHFLLEQATRRPPARKRDSIP